MLKILRHSLSTRNPVMKEEYRYQWQILLRSRAHIVWIIMAAVLLIPAMVGGLAATVRVLLMPFVRLDLRLLPSDFDSLLITLMVTMMLAMHAVVVLVMLSLATNAVTRERSGQTWEPLLLTGMDARQLLLGKWWASVRTMLNDFAMIALLRIGVLASLFSWTLAVWLPEAELWRLSAYMLFGAGAVTLYTLVDACFTSAVGLLATMLLGEDGSARGLAMALRVAVAIAMTTLLIYCGGEMLRLGIPAVVPTLLVPLAVFTALMLVTLEVMLRASRWQGVLSPGEG